MRVVPIKADALKFLSPFGITCVDEGGVERFINFECCTLRWIEQLLLQGVSSKQMT